MNTRKRVTLGAAGLTAWLSLFGPFATPVLASIDGFKPATYGLCVSHDAVEPSDGEAGPYVFTGNGVRHQPAVPEEILVDHWPDGLMACHYHNQH